MADDIRVKYSADASSYKQSLKDLQQQNKTLKSELDKVKSSTDENTTSQEKAAKVAEAIQKQVKGQEEYIKALKDQYEKLSRSEGDNTTELMKQEEKINKAETALNKMNDELSEAQREADGATTTTDNLATSMEKMRSAEIIADIMGKVSESFQKVASSAYDAAKELDAGYDTIVKKTGASGSALQEMTDIADELYSNMPSSMEDIGDAVGEVNTRLNLTGDDLKDTSELFLKFSRINDTDVSTSVDTVQKALSAFGLTAKDTPKILNTMTAAGQATGVGMNELASAMVKNAGALSELGLNAEQSIMFIGKLEKSGVDSETALSGMSRALKNATAQGIPLNEALADLEDEIINGTDSMDGLSVAYDLFGKSGDKIYNAVKTGSLSFKDLDGAVEDYSGTVESTYEGTLSAWDKSTVAINNLKLAGSELAGEALEALAPLFDKIVDAAKGLVKWFKNLSPNTKKLVAVLGALAAGAGVALPKLQGIASTISMLKTANAVKAMGSLSQATGSVTTNATQASGAMALLTNPLTLATAAVAGVGLALAGLAKHTENMIQAEYGLTDAEKEQIQAAEDAKAAYDDMAAARKESVDGITAEYGYIEDLVDEYNGLIDSNGKVKAGYEDRAEYILTQLAEATGKTIDDIKSEIGANGQLQSSIKETIRLKQAEATLSAYQESYTQAIQNSKTAMQDYYAAVDTATEKQRKYEEAVANQSSLQSRRAELVRQAAALDKNSTEYANLQMQIGDLDTMLTEETASIRTAKDAWDKAKKAVSDTGQVYAGYQNTIKNYEGVQAAIISGDASSIKYALERLTENFQTAENSTKESLEQQVKDTKENLDAMEKAFKDGRADREALGLAKRMYSQAQGELKKFKGLGKNVADGLKDGMTAEQGKAYKKARDLGRKTTQEVAKGAETNSPSRATKKTGNDVGQGLIEGMKAKEAAVSSGGKALGQKATGGVTEGADKKSVKKLGGDVADSLKLGIAEKKELVSSKAREVRNAAVDNIKPTSDNKAGVYSSGQSTGAQLGSGIKNKQGEVETKARQVRDGAVNSVKPTANNKSGVYSAGQSTGAQLGSGIKNKQGEVEAKARQVRDGAVSNIKPNYWTVYDVGKNMAQGLADGLKKSAYLVNAEASNVASQSIRTMRNIAQVKSPSKVMMKIGQYMNEGLALGLKDTKAVDKAVAALGEATINPMLSFGEAGINGNAVSKSLSYGDIVVNVNGANVQNEDLLAKKITAQIFRQVKAERMAWA